MSQVLCDEWEEAKFSVGNIDQKPGAPYRVRQLNSDPSVRSTAIGRDGFAPRRAACSRCNS